MHLFSYIFLTALLGSFIVQWTLLYRHRNHVRLHKDNVPVQFRDKVPLSDHQRAAAYTIAKSQLAIVDLVLGTLLLLLWTLGGGLQLIDTQWRSLGLSELWTGTGVLLSVMLVSSMLDLPMALYRTFVLEERFGFNKTTVRVFITDLIKSTALTVLIGAPLLALILWLMGNAGQQWWLYVWMTWFGFSMFMMWFYPAFIAPLFNKFRPLENTVLKARIEQLLTRNGFASQGIFVMDGSSRSTHGNAYFTGMGSNKRIVFFDTLMNELSHEEIEAVLAHELGHFRCNHVKKRIGLMAVTFLAGFALLGWLIDKLWFYTALGVDSSSTWMALTLFMMVIPVFTFYIQPLMSWYSRLHEFEADNFASAQGSATDLIQALVKLYKENANTLTPDPLYSAFYDSHPPAPVRVAHLTKQSETIG